MKSKEFTEREFPYFGEEYFELSILEKFMIANYNKKNFDIFMESDIEKEFMKNIVKNKVDTKKELLIINSQKDKKFLMNFNYCFHEIYSLLINPANNLETLINERKEQTILIVMKYIKYFIDNDYEIYHDTKINEATNTMFDYFRVNNDILSFLSFSYINNHYDEMKISKNRKDRFRQLIELYLDKFHENFDKELIICIDKSNLDNNKSYEKAIKKKDKIIQEKKNELIQLKEKLEILKRKVEENDKANNSMKEEISIEDKEQIISTLQNELDEVEEKYIIRHKYDQLDSSYKKLKEKYDERGKMINEFKRKVKMKDSFSKENAVEKIEEYLKINRMSSKLYQVIYPYYVEHREIDTSKTFVKNIKNNELIGYCLIKDNKHYFVDIDQTKYQIYNIPKASYLTQRQFVKVDSNLNLIDKYNNYYSKNGDDVRKYAVARIKDGKLYAEIDSNNLVKIEVPKNYNIRDGMVIGLSVKNRFLRTYKAVKFNLDFCRDSIIAKNHLPIMITKLLENGITGIDLLTEKEIYIPIESDCELYRNNIIFVENDKVISMVDSSSFYTQSENYNKYEYAIVVIDDNRKFIQKLNGEKILLNSNNVSININNDDVVKVDEFNQIIEIADSDVTEVKSIEEKLLNTKNNKNNKSVKINNYKIAQEDKILLIGDIALSDTYIKNFRKEGYEAEVISGFETYHKIAKKAHSCDHIILITECASHENYYKLKDDFKNKIQYIHETGIHRIIEEFNGNK